MGVRVSRAEKLDFCLQALDKLYKQLDKHFDTFMGYDIQFSAEGNSLYNVEPVAKCPVILFFFLNSWSFS